MSGGLLHNFRQGNRSELLADYLLSAIGISTPVRRQDDYGFDFYCQLSDQQSGYLTFGYPFVIQIKSDSSEKIAYGNLNAKKWKKENTSWLFRNDLPFFVGIVDKAALSISIFDTTGLWQVYNSNSENYSYIELIPTIHPMGEMRENCKMERITDWEESGDGIRYTIDMGNPIVTIAYTDLENDHALWERKETIRAIVRIEQQNIIHRKLGIRAFEEVKENAANVGHIYKGMSLNPHPASDVSKIYRSLDVGLTSLLISLDAQGRHAEVAALKIFLGFMPKSEYDDQLLSSNSEFFDYMTRRNAAGL